VPPGDVDALNDAILKILLNEEVASKMSKQNLNFAQSESWSAVAKAYEDAYIALIKS
jgi:glycosyltransferase involved in cell wall biosynthesis